MNNINKTDKISFSIVVPLYNKEISCRTTIQSILNQNYSEFELIIVNDGSTDNSLNVVKEFTDNRIRIINKQNGGVSSARNRGILEAKNEIVVFLDADDLWAKDTLTEFVYLIENFNEASVYLTNYRMSDCENRGSGRRYYIDNFYYYHASFMAKYSLSLMLNGCIAVKKECFNLVGNFKEGITNGEDVDMWFRLAMNFKMAKSEKVTTVYRLNTENKNCDMDDKDRTEPSPITIKRSDIKTMPEKLYYGISFLFKIRIFLTKKRYHIIFELIKYSDWMVYAIFFIFKLRYLNQKIK